MEWAVLAAFTAAAAALIALPGSPNPGDAAGAEQQEMATLMSERELLLAELRELDDDATMGRIAPDDRIAGRRGVAPRLRAVTEALRAHGWGDDRHRNPR